MGSVGLGIALFLGTVFILTLLLGLQPRRGFLLLLGTQLLFYVPFLRNVLFTIGTAKVYPIDLVLASFLGYLVLRVLHRPLLVGMRSTRWFMAFFVWGLVAIVRGIPEYGYSALGESRWYTLPILYYFFVFVLSDRQYAFEIVRWFLRFSVAMVVFRFFDFYFLGGKTKIAPEYWADYRTIFRFVSAPEALMVAFAVMLLMVSYVLGRRSKRSGAYLWLGLLLIAVVVSQHRSVWVAMAVGFLALGGMMIRRFVRSKVPTRGVLLLHSMLLLLALFFVAVAFVERDIYASIVRSALFLRDPLSDPTGSWRLTGWQQEMAVAMKHPVFGGGLGKYSEWFDGYRWQRVAVHNGYIMFFSKFGVVGLFLFLGGVISWYREMGHCIRREHEESYRLVERALQICVAMHLVFAFFYDFTPFFWVLLAVGTALVGRDEARGWAFRRGEVASGVEAR